jgi:hypothetical protein
MRQYLSKKKDLYLFRRRVPDEIVQRVGKREIYRSLGTFLTQTDSEARRGVPRKVDADRRRRLNAQAV